MITHSRRYLHARENSSARVTACRQEIDKQSVSFESERESDAYGGDNCGKEERLRKSGGCAGGSAWALRGCSGNRRNGDQCDGRERTGEALHDLCLSDVN